MRSGSLILIGSMVLLAACGSTGEANDLFQPAAPAVDGGAGQAGAGGSAGTGGGIVDAGTEAALDAGTGGGPGGGGTGGASGGGTGGTETGGAGNAAGAAGSGGTAGTAGTAGTGPGGTGGGPPPPTGEIPCDPAVCELPTEACCLSFEDFDIGECVPANQAGTCQTVARCAGPEDCPTGATCCGDLVEWEGTWRYTRVECRPSCTGPTQVLFCDPNDAYQTCPFGQYCGGSDIMPDGYSVCRT